MPYPFSYFSSILTPKKMLANRRVLTLWQQLFTSLFLIALLLIPVSLQTASLDHYPLENFVEGVFDPLTDQKLAEIAPAIRLENKQLTYTGSQHFEGISFGEQAEQTTGFSYQFAKEEIIIRKGETVLASLSYQGLTQTDFESSQALAKAISTNWYQANRIPISLTITGVSAVILATNFLFVVFGASFFLFLTKKSRFFHFQSFSECVTFSLNCLGLPSLLACLIGLLGQPVTTILTLQNIAFILVLIWVFFQTKFRDEA